MSDPLLMYRLLTRAFGGPLSSGFHNTLDNTRHHINQGVSRTDIVGTLIAMKVTFNALRVVFVSSLHIQLQGAV